MWETIEPAYRVLVAGLALGCLFGAVVHRINFCSMGAVADVVLSGKWQRMRTWVLAIAVAIIGTQLIQATGWVDLAQTRYLVPQLHWGGAVLGGLLFGFGMVIACGCTSKSLVQFASGDCRALVTLVMIGVSAAMTLRGMMALPRTAFEEVAVWQAADAGWTSQGLAEHLARASGVELPMVQLATGLLIGGGLLFWVLRNQTYRRALPDITAGVLLGLCVPLAWLATGLPGADPFEPAVPQGMTFVAPTADSLQYLMIFTGTQVDFGIAVVCGVLAGAGSAALLDRSFRIQGFEESRDFLRYVCGGLLMGSGGVLALGCTVGQGLTGIATLGACSVLALASILAGAVLGVRYLEEGSMRLLGRRFARSVLPAHPEAGR